MKKAYMILLSCTMLLLSCGKDFLDAKPDKALALPSTLKDLRALLDNTAIMNNNTAFLGEVGSGDYDPLPSRFMTIQAKERNSLVWAKDIFETQFAEDWDWSFRRIFYANRVLEGLEDLDGSAASREELDELRGSALFFRAYTNFQLAQLFCRQYDAQTSATDPGLPLRLASDINIPSRRSTVKETYEQILSDAGQAAELLPATAVLKTRPSRHAAHALLASIYLQMEDYGQALKYADLCLQTSNSLMDYNTLNVSANFPVPRYNEEVIFQSLMLFGNSFNNVNMYVNGDLYALYAENDIRKTAFFRVNKGVVNYKGSYNGTREYFNGFSNDEVLLIAAECHARNNEAQQAVDMLNTFRVKRWKQGTYELLLPGTAEDALRMVLEERRRELAFRGRRWQDLRRLNKDSRFAQTLTRTIDNVTYTLPPNDARYVLPLPPQVIALTSMEQNPR